MKDRLKKFFTHPAVEALCFAVVWTMYSYVASVIYSDVSSFFLTAMVWGPAVIMWVVFIFMLFETRVLKFDLMFWESWFTNNGTGSWFSKNNYRKSTGIYEDIGRALSAHGWKIDTDPNINSIGECKEFIHPATGERLAWLDAVHEQMDIEYEEKNK